MREPRDRGVAPPAPWTVSGEKYRHSIPFIKVLISLSWVIDAGNPRSGAIRSRSSHAHASPEREGRAGVDAGERGLDVARFVAERLGVYDLVERRGESASAKGIERLSAGLTSTAPGSSRPDSAQSLVGLCALRRARGVRSGRGQRLRFGVTRLFFRVPASNFYELLDRRREPATAQRVERLMEALTGKGSSAGSERE